MSQSSATATNSQPASMSCPTCNARQPWSDECRRCKTDLSELRAVWWAARQAARACLDSLRDGDWPSAVRHARRFRALDACDESDRLLAVSCLLHGQYRQALQIVASAIDSESPSTGHLGTATIGNRTNP